MKSQEIDLLRAQLTEILTEILAEAPEATGLERAALAGLLARLMPDDPLVAQTEAGLGDPVIQAIAQAGEHALAMIESIDEEDDPALSWNALCAMDEACAASWLVARPALVEGFVEEATATVRAFPEPFASHAEAASTVLRERAPRAGDPAWGLWAAVELSAVALPLDEAGASFETRLALQLPVVLSRLGPSAGIQLQAHDGGLPEEAPMEILARGEGWELLYTLDPQERPILLYSGAGEALLICDGEARAWSADPEGQVCLATPGAWTVTVDGKALHFRIEA